MSLRDVATNHWSYHGQKSMGHASKVLGNNDKLRTIIIQSPRRDYENLKMKEEESMTDYFSKLMKLANQMETLGETIKNKRMAKKHMTILPQKYDPIDVAIEKICIVFMRERIVLIHMSKD